MIPTNEKKEIEKKLKAFVNESKSINKKLKQKNDSRRASHLLCPIFNRRHDRWVIYSKTAINPYSVTKRAAFSL